jgi:hypothetical protein
MADFWISWYNAVPLSTFELHSPWWISGYDANDRETMVAAVRADSEAAAWEQVRTAYDDPPTEVAERFIEDLPAGSPFSGRFPQYGWMAWDDDRTCGCDACTAAPEPPTDQETHHDVAPR